MNFINSNLSSGSVIIKQSNKYGFAPVYMILGIPATIYKDFLEDIQAGVERANESYFNIRLSLDNIDIQAVCVGYLFVDENGLIKDNGAIEVCRDMIRRFLTGQIKIRPEMLDYIYSFDSNVIKELCVNPKTVETFLLKCKLANNNMPVYYSLDVYRQEVKTILYPREKEFDLFEKLNRVVLDIAQGKQKGLPVTSIRTGDVLLRCTPQRYKMYLVVDNRVVEIAHDVNTSANIFISLATIKNCIAKVEHEPIKELSYYYQTGVNLYDILRT